MVEMYLTKYVLISTKFQHFDAQFKFICDNNKTLVIDMLRESISWGSSQSQDEWK